ncbi:unnamed protein product [Brachionus calyciflorus]|uniref:G-protein coupled receptors family 1 profile domain-containing protein n=1 Tax=Brachionus calyciflorus TaxID=104777 RepID=A0A813SU54_9BILA|nr:unnamed protein product [Brachionus calyciflorus]
MDLTTGIFDYPISTASIIFGYWPFHSAVANIWATYDNGYNTITCSYMFYLSYILLRSIRAPLNFKNEFLVRNPKKVLASIWLISFSIWSAIANSYGLVAFTLGINFKTSFEIFIYSFLLWFIPLICLLIIGIVLIINMNVIKKTQIQIITNRNQNEITQNKIRKIELMNRHAQYKIVLLIFTFWVQWMTPCFLTVFNNLFNLIPTDVMSKVYWITYIVCFTDPIIQYVLNPNISFDFTNKKKDQLSSMRANNTVTKFN